MGAWQYSIPTDASPETVDWDRFLGEAPKRPFDADRFFRWRKYWDYGTAVAGDLFVHLLTGIHHATGALGPTRVAAMGGQRYWNDGREVYDLIMGLLDYPETAAHPAFTLALQTDFEDGGGANSLFRFVGSDGVIDVTFRGLKVSRVGIARETPEQVLKGYNSVVTFSKAQQEAYAAKLAKESARRLAVGRSRREARVVPGAARLRRAVRSLRQVLPLGPRGRRRSKKTPSSATARRSRRLLCNDSYRQGKMIGWDPVAMRIVS